MWSWNVCAYHHRGEALAAADHLNIVALYVHDKKVSGDEFIKLLQAAYDECGSQEDADGSYYDPSFCVIEMAVK